jgi:hypothetical protein
VAHGLCCVTSPIHHPLVDYSASGMTLYVHSDASYLSETGARSRAAGHFFLSFPPRDPASLPATLPPLNCPTHTMCKLIDDVVGSASEAEIGAGYLNAQEAVPICTTLRELRHPQPPTPMQVDSTTAEGFANGTMKQKRSKAMNMRWHWLKDRTHQGHLWFITGRVRTTWPILSPNTTHLPISVQ